MKAFWVLFYLTMLDALTLGSFLAQRDVPGIVAGLVIVPILVALAVREYRRALERARWEAALTAEASLRARGGGEWRGGDR